MLPFSGRNLELRPLTNQYQRPEAQLLVVYGRRRVGKTRLLTYWADQLNQPYLYWMASQTSAVNQLRDFSQQLFRFLNPTVPIDATFSYLSWEAAFAELQRASQQQRLVVILDEFTYVMQANPELPSLIQRAWDHQLKNSQIFLILSGSLAGIIQRVALDYQSPLYGRATARLKLHPLSYGVLADLLPNYNAEERVAVYTMTGGVPAYIELFDDRQNILANLQQRIVSPTNVMLTDGVFLLREQVEEPRNYIAILESIAAGFHNLSDIAKMAGIDRSNIAKYLGVLQELGYVDRVVPATVHRPEQSRQGRYVIVDPYLRFYYRFLAKNLPAIERGRLHQTISLLYDHLLDFIGSHTFEELCREWVEVSAEMNGLPFLPERVGSYWAKEAQIDVVAINWRTRQLLLGECKWGKPLVGPNVIQTLVQKSPKVLPDAGKWELYYAFFARSGFSPETQSEAKNHFLVTLEQLEGDLGRWVKMV